MESEEQILIPTVTPNEFLPPISLWLKLGGLASVGVFTGVIVVFNFWQYNVTVKAPAVIRPTGDLRIIEAAINSRVVQITVKPNQTVKQGEEIVILDDSQLQTEKRQLEITLTQLKAQIEQTEEQMFFLENQIKAERVKLDHAIAGAKADRELSQRRYQQEQIVTQTNTMEAEAALRFAQEEFNRFEQLGNIGVIPDLQIKEKQAARETAQARLQRSQALLYPSQGEVIQSEAILEQAIANRDAVLAQLDSQRQQIKEKQTDLHKQLLNQLQELEQLKLNLEQTIIRSPINGIVQTLELRNPKQFVQEGEIVGYISPSSTPLVMKASVNHTDISRVKLGQQVKIRVESCPYPDYGVADGKISEIAPDSPDGAGIYEVIIQPSRLILQNKEKTCKLQSGMQGRADIITEQDTILGFFLRKIRLFINQ